jgi:hypothetical protein
MKKNLRLTLLLFLNFAIFIPYAKSQIKLEQELLDSILSITVEYLSDYDPTFTLYPNYPTVIKFKEAHNNSNTIFTASTWITIRNDIPKGSFLYLWNHEVHFLIIGNVPLDQNLQARLVSPESYRYKQILDSLKMPYRPIDGVMAERGKLVVYKDKRRILSKTHFVITSQPYIPYNSAPEELQPILDFADGASTNTISYRYYGNRLRLNEAYYNDLKPIKPVKFRLSRKKN